MTPTELEAIKPILDRIIADTQAARMNWTRTNPTTFVWKRVIDNKPVAQLNIQKIVQRQPTVVAGPPARQIVRDIESYVFQVVELPSNIRKTINTQQDPEALTLLKDLFGAVTVNADKDALDFLKRIIEPI